MIGIWWILCAHLNFPNLVSYENCVQKVGNFVDNCVRYVSIEQTYVGFESAKWTTASQKRPFSVIPKGANSDANLKKTKSVTSLVCIPDTFLQSIGMLPWKKSVLSFSWNVFDFEDDSKKEVWGYFDVSTKKKKLLKIEPVELVVPWLKGAMKDTELELCIVYHVA